MICRDLCIIKVGLMINLIKLMLLKSQHIMSTFMKIIVLLHLKCFFFFFLNKMTILRNPHE